MSVRVLLFDLDDTLLDTHGSAAAAVAATSALARERIAGLSDEQIHATYHAVVREVDQLLGDRKLHFTTAWELHLHRWREILARCEADPDHAPVLAERYRHTRREHYRPYPGVTELLPVLGERYRLALLTNGPGEMQREKIAAVGLERWIPTSFISGELGAWKPHPDIFRHALEQMQSAPAETVMIGDSLTNDILGGAAVGLRTVWVNRFGHTLPAEVRPDAVLTDLRDLPAVLARW